MSVTAALVASFSFVFAVVWAGIVDLLTFKIRNELVLFLIGVYAALAPLAGWTLAEIGINAAVAGCALALSLICFGLGWIGGGDAKLASIVVLWLGAEHTTAYLAYAALIGGVLSLALLQFRLMVLPAFCLRTPWIIHLHDRGTGVPYGVPLAVAALVIFPDTLWMNTLL
ncbi:prepilin peptidase [Microvirga aerilata]|uniref:Prepilin peptidase n=1 Tax=Microvirga aerilata TaxID=670292 RepID=A0A937D3M4_9HYPH|nr:prepilin peptidase [Microvirga aerilata]